MTIEQFNVSWKHLNRSISLFQKHFFAIKWKHLTMKCSNWVGGTPMTLTLVTTRGLSRAAVADSFGKDETEDGELPFPEWAMIRQILGIGVHTWLAVTSRAVSIGVPFQAELIASGVVTEEEFIRALAKFMQVGFLANIKAEGLILTEEQSFQALGRQKGLPIVSALNRSGKCVLLIAPAQIDLEEITKYLKHHPEMCEKMFFVPTSVLRNALGRRAKNETLRKALGGLLTTFPQFSARVVLTGRQGLMVGLMLAGDFVCLVNWPSTTLLITHIVLSLCCFFCVALKFVVMIGFRKRHCQAVLQDPKPDEMPVYTVLIALYKEAEVIPELLVSLGRLVWPKSKLEIKLVCESDDHETLAAIRAIDLRSHVEVVEVPVSQPRTKPKALSYALPLSTGDYVVIFDAEDRPHPYQLIEAWRRFRESDENLACLQAPLVIGNRNGSWLSRMFAFEYSALFTVILPWLAQHRLALPLGGTSNHFRRSALEEAGGWDPYNVTEDADLGIRFYRMGYDIGTISCPTYEDAPMGINVWLPQRTRWFKGWIQTWLVHMRHPCQLFRELGPASFAVTQVLFPCTLIAVLSNLLFLAALVYGGVWFAITGSIPPYYSVLFLFDLINIVLGYCGFLAVGWVSLPAAERQGFWKYALLTPLYWMALSMAGWRAVWQIYSCPHYWEKTPHLPRKRGVRIKPGHDYGVAGLVAQRKKAGPEPTSLGSSVPIAPLSQSA